VTACFTVDVEDWYDGIAELGHQTSTPTTGPSGLEALGRLLETTPGQGTSRLTLFVVGKYAHQVGDDLRQLAAGGHELASHGPDHGWPPEDPIKLEDWLRRGRMMVEDVAGSPVEGFRSPRFDVPASMGLDAYREILARAGFTYVSDRHFLGAASPVRELPVFRWKGLPLGGGSYQRLLPRKSLGPLLHRSKPPTVLYYHSYDFGVSLPSPWSTRSPAVLKQVVARDRIPTIFSHLLQSVGSTSCLEAARGL
jgi:hypothetical protein